MHPQTPTYSDGRSEASVGFASVSFYGRRGVDYTKYRTRRCRNYEMGLVCPFGERCAFSHGESEANSMSMEEAEMMSVLPPSYEEATQTGVIPPAYSSRFRYDPYSFTGVMYE